MMYIRLSLIHIFYEGYRFFDKNILAYPARDIIFYSADVHGQALVRQRLSVVRKLLEGEPVTVVTTMDGLMDSLLPMEMCIRDRNMSVLWWIMS